MEKEYGFVRRHWKFFGGLSLVAGSVGAGVAYLNHELHSAEGLGPLPPELTEGTVGQESYICFSEVPNCDGSTALAVLSSGGNMVPRPLDQIDDDLEHAVVAVEDQRFFEHDGVDNPSIVRAILANGWASIKDRSPTISQGASTIEMQLARNLFLGDRPTNDFSRKTWEAEQALKLNRDYTKPQILEKYLNVVNYGRGAYSAETASLMYFGKPASDLTFVEAATLAATVQSPDSYDGSSDPNKDVNQRAALESRRNEVIDNMAEQGYITAEEYDAFKNGTNPQVELDTYVLPYQTYPISFSIDYAKANEIGARHYLDMLLSEVRERSGYSEVDLTKNLRINTTLSLEVQTNTHDAIQNGTYTRDGRQIAAVVLRQDGSIAALYGGDYQTLQVNLATTPVVTGSGDKPWAYVSQFESGAINLDSTFPDPPAFTWEGGDNGKDWVVRSGNYCASDASCTVREAVAKSSNMVILQAMENAGQPGLDRMDQLMDAFGIPSETPPTPAIILGSREATLLDRTAGMNGLLANSGKSVPHRLLNSICADENGGGIDPAITSPVCADSDEQLAVKFDYASPQWGAAAPQQVIAPEIAEAVIEALRGPIRNGTASGNLGDFPTDAAGKTGTHDNNVMAAFIGSACFRDGNMTIGILERYPDRLASLGDGETGGKVPAQIFRAIGLPLVGDMCSLNG